MTDNDWDGVICGGKRTGVHRLGWLVVLATALAATACGEDAAPLPGEGAGGTAGTGQPHGGGGDGGSGGHGGADKNPCPVSGPCVKCHFLFNGRWGEPMQGEEECLWDCQLPKPCGMLHFQGGSANPAKNPSWVPAPGELKFAHPDDTEAALKKADCIFAALRDGTQGKIGWLHTDDCAADGCEYALSVTPNRAALYESFYGWDVDHETNSIGPAALREPAYFEACRAETDPAAIWNCLMGWTDQVCAP
ncbi:MAG: hypothetical protein HY744_17280 [Deltaproteobacteria bacterium]|nr:hypothetical protein [Deltaproteobacteria bacterium]